MATKPQFTSTAVAADPTLAQGAATSRVPIANLETAVAVGGAFPSGNTSTKREGLEEVQKGLMAARISVRRAADGGGRSKPTLADVNAALAAVLS